MLEVKEDLWIYYKISVVVKMDIMMMERVKIVSLASFKVVDYVTLTEIVLSAKISV